MAATPAQSPKHFESLPPMPFAQGQEGASISRVGRSALFWEESSDEFKLWRRHTEQ